MLPINCLGVVAAAVSPLKGAVLGLLGSRFLDSNLESLINAPMCARGPAPPQAGQSTSFARCAMAKPWHTQPCFCGARGLLVEGDAFAFPSTGRLPRHRRYIETCVVRAKRPHEAHKSLIGPLRARKPYALSQPSKGIIVDHPLEGIQN